MSAHNFGPVPLMIPSGQNDSAALSSALSTGQMKIVSGSNVGLVATGPEALTGVVTLQSVPLEGSTTWVTVQQTGSDVTIAATKGVPVNTGAFRDLRFHSNAAEGADRTFYLTFQLVVTT